MSDITIVTAFFDVGREKWRGKFKRDINTYIENFKFWARIRNELVIYTEKNVSEKIWEVRKNFGLEKKTKIIVIDDIMSLDTDIYMRMKRALSHPLAVKNRKRPNNPECYNYVYNYVMLLKAWVLQETVRRNLAKDMIAWIDFAYNHGGEYYTHAEEFDFLWQYKFSSKIHFFSLNEPDNIPIFELVKNMNTYFTGGFIVLPICLATELWRLYRESMIHLTSVGMCDDDQTLMLMAYREKPEIFEIHHIDGWFEPWKKFGGEHLQIKPKKQKIGSLFFRLKNFARKGKDD